MNRRQLTLVVAASLFVTLCLTFPSWAQNDGLPLSERGDIGIVVQHMPMTLTIAVPLGVLGVQTMTVPLDLELSSLTSYSSQGIVLSGMDVTAFVGDTGEYNASIDIGEPNVDRTWLLFEVTPAPTETPTPGPSPTPTSTPTATPPLPIAPSCTEILNVQATSDTDGFLEYRRNRVIGKWLVDWEGIVSEIDPRPPGFWRAGYNLDIDSLREPCDVFLSFDDSESLSAFTVGQHVSVTAQIENIASIFGWLTLFVDTTTLQTESIQLSTLGPPPSPVQAEMQ